MSTRPAPPIAASPTEQSSTDAITDALRLRLLRVVQAINQEERSFPVSSAQRAVLRWLVLQPLRVSDLARAQGVSLPTMTQLTQRLIRAGWVERRSPEGTYNNQIQITPEGRVIVAQAARRQNAYLQARVDRLTPAERAKAHELLPILDRMFVREPWH